MELRQLRRRQVRREAAAYLCIPFAYGLLMAAGVFLFVPAYLALNFLLVLFMLLQMRAGRVASALARSARPGGARAQGLAPAPAVHEADERFVRQATYQGIFDASSFVVFLAGVDLSLRAALGGNSGGPALLFGGALALVVHGVGRRLARERSWEGFAERHPELWKNPTGLDGGRALRSSASYYDWRLAAEPPGGGPP